MKPFSELWRIASIFGTFTKMEFFFYCNTATIHSHSPLYRAKAELDEALVVLDSFEGFHDALDSKKLIMAPFCGEIACEDNIKRDSAR